MTWYNIFIIYTHWCLGGVRGPESLFLSYFELQNSHTKVTRNDNKSSLGKHLKTCLMYCGVPGIITGVTLIKFIYWSSPISGFIIIINLWKNVYRNAISKNKLYWYKCKIIGQYFIYIPYFVIFTKPTLKACTIRIKKRVSCECFLSLFTSNVSNIEARFNNATFLFLVK